MKKKYKALMLDLDGTTIPNKKDGLPSENVKKAIRKASKLIHIGTATARPPFLVNYILDQLQLSGPSVVSGGSQIIDSTTRKIIWARPMLKKDIVTIDTICKKFGVVYLYDEDKNSSNKTNDSSGDVFQLYFTQLPEKTVEKLIEVFSEIPTIAIHRVPAWEKGKADFVITHAIATKQHGILEVAKILGIETHDIIGVGDGYNDFPLLMACGLKVAMGNAVPELKAIADYIAPTVDDDGVADVIEKFVL